MASNDESACGMLRALAERGPRVPEDVAVAGFDDRPDALAQEPPPLTAAHHPTSEIGCRALELPLGYIAGTRGSDEVVRQLAAAFRSVRLYSEAELDAFVQKPDAEGQAFGGGMRYTGATRDSILREV